MQRPLGPARCWASPALLPVQLPWPLTILWPATHAPGCRPLRWLVLHLNPSLAICTTSSLSKTFQLLFEKPHRSNKTSSAPYLVLFNFTFSLLLFYLPSYHTISMSPSLPILFTEESQYLEEFLACSWCSLHGIQPFEENLGRGKGREESTSCGDARKEAKPKEGRGNGLTWCPPKNGGMTQNLGVLISLQLPFICELLFKLSLQRLDQHKRRMQGASRWGSSPPQPLCFSVDPAGSAPSGWASPCPLPWTFPAPSSLTLLGNGG